MGIKQQRAGAGWEDHVEVMLGVIRPHVWWTRNYPRMHYVSGKGWVVTGTAVPDFSLVWQGIPMLIDCKSTDNKKTYKPYKDQEHQFIEMTRADRSGMLAGYLVEWRQHDKVTFHRVQDGHVHSEYKMGVEPKDIACVVDVWDEHYLRRLLEMMVEISLQ